VVRATELRRCRQTVGCRIVAVGLAIKVIAGTVMMGCDASFRSTSS
jgi:hypothetical protein